MKKVLPVVLVICLVFCLSGCDFFKDFMDSATNTTAQEKTFEFDGISIDLTTTFLRMDFLSEDYSFVVGNKDVVVMGLKTAKDDNSVIGEMDVLTFAKSFRTLLTSSDPTEVTEMDGIPTLQYTSDESGKSQTVAAMFYDSSECFWIVLFVVDTDKFDAHYEEICKYAKTVKCE